METWDAITSRRNVRSFADRAIAPADLDRILEAGRRGPVLAKLAAVGLYRRHRS
jgi:nitroreductase